MHARQPGPDQFVINLLRNRPTVGIDLLPPRSELRQIAAPFFDRGFRPIAHPARPLHSIYIIAGKRRVFGAPNPKIIRELIEHFRLRVRAAESDREHDHHCEGGQGGSTSLLVDAKNNAASPL